MNVLIVTDEMELGGSQRQITELALALVAGGDSVTVCFFRTPSQLVDALRAGGVSVVHLPKSGRLDLGFVARLHTLVLGGDFDVVHAFSFTAELWTAVATRFAGGGARPPLVSSIRGTYEWYTPLQWRLKAWVTRRSEAVVSNASAAADFAYARMGGPQTLLAIVRNGIAEIDDPAALRARHRAALGIDGDAPVAMFVGRLVEHKNLPMLVRAMKRLADRGARTRLLVVGDGPDGDALRAAIEAAGLGERIALLGERGDAATLFCAADVAVLASWREGLPNVLIEAMQAGCAVVATRVGGVPELVHDGEQGLLVPSDDDAALADALVRLEEDRALLQRLGRTARETARRDYGVSAMARSVRAVYTRAIGPAAERPASPIRHA